MIVLLLEKATTADSTARIRFDRSGSSSVDRWQSSVLWAELRQQSQRAVFLAFPVKQIVYNDGLT